MEQLMINELMHVLRKETGMKVTEIAEIAGVSKQFVSDKMRAKEMYVRTAARFLNAFGYRLVAVPRNERTKDSWYEII